MSWKIAPEMLDILIRVSNYLAEQGIEAFAVGGLVRDILLERPCADLDIALAGDAPAAAGKIADKLAGKFVLLDEGHGIARVVLGSGEGQWYIDLSGYTGDIGGDLARRDFTIDAMAVNLREIAAVPASFKIIDPFGGQKDIAEKTIRALDDGVFRADPARIMRAVRLAAELVCDIHPGTAAMLTRDHALAASVAGERVREELLRILANQRAGRFILLLDRLKVLTALIPELEASRGVSQPAEHHWDVLEHSLETVRSADFILRQDEWEYASPSVLYEVPWSEDLSRHFAETVSAGSTHASLLKLAALLHDISKPETKILSRERIRFYGHTEQGAETVALILERLRFSHKEISLVENMVRYHMRPTQMSHEGLPTNRAIYRYFRDTGEAGIDILFLSLADHLAARGPELDAEQWDWHTRQVKSILAGYYQQPGTISPAKLLDGHDLISLFGLKPGPEIRVILESIREAQAAGEIYSREEALSYVKNRLLYREQK